MTELTEVPVWLEPLARAARAVDPTDLSRFLPPEDGTGRPSAVLMTLGETADGPGVLLIERAADMRAHAGQVAFPGGSIDPHDDGPVGAALREAEEEVGLDPATVRVVAQLPALFIPVTGFVVTPVLAWWTDPHPVAAVDPVEVARAEVVPIATLAEPANRFRVRHPSGLVGPGFDAAGLFVWGFTAGLLDVLLRLGGWAREWDTERERPLPPHLVGRPSR
ncbi:MAG: CoA pyrophosphatase [Actinomycetota bacterium]|nr:CoA pyrophosphatase [Actinomycetota bacterium]